MHGRRRPSALQLSTSATDIADLAAAAAESGDISLASTLPSPVLGGSSGRPSALRRASSVNSGVPSSSGSGSGPSAAAIALARKRKSTLTRANDLPTTLLNQDLLSRLNEWILCIAVVQFDLDKGPEFDNCYPPVQFTSTERNAIAFSSFPDHNEKGESTSSFSWRLPRYAEDGASQSTYLYGFCFFSQERNTNIRRGYAQRSLVVISKLDSFPGLFMKMVNLLGPTYFRHSPVGGPIVETAVMNICRWPPPQPGTLELGFLNNILLVEIPLAHQAQYRIPISSSSSSLRPNTRQPHFPPPPSPGSISLLSSLPHTTLTELLRETIDQLWLIWELVILAQPILVYAADTKYASELVQWLVTIIRPLPFAGDYRPFFHIHTPDFAILLNNNKPRPGLILGATNPLILSGARHFPHIIRLSKPLPSSSSLYPGSSSNPSSSASTPVQGVFGTLSRSTASSSFKEAEASKHGLFSERKRTVRKDRAALKEAQDRLKAFDYAGADAILLRCMSSLTERFLVPLNRYFGTLLLADQSDGLSTPRQTRAFNYTHFIQSLKTHGTPLDFRRSKLPSMHMNSNTDSSANANAISFYEKFLQSPNFLTWIQDRTETLQSTTRDRYLKQLETNDPETYLRGKSDAEMTDLLQRLETEARITDTELATTPIFIRERSASYDHSILSSSAGSMSKQDELRARSGRLKSQMERVKAMRQAMVDSSEDSDASSRDHH